jgi:site-specific DNA-cytosine methylase
MFERRIRRLTPTECERLQGFPDGWTKYYADGTEVSDSQRYKMLGNAVTVNVIRAIAEAINPPSPTVTAKNRAENALVEEKSIGI